MAKICLTVAQSQGAKDVKLSDFMFDFESEEKEQPEQTEEYMKALLKSLCKKKGK